MKKVIRLTENDISRIVKLVINEYYPRKKPIPKYSDDDKLELIKDQNIVNGGNFGIKRNGVEYWVSRSNTVSLYVYCKDKMNNWYVLASQRGPKAKFSGKWNVVCGFLDYGYTLEETAVKECQEETGVKININNIHNIGTNSSKKRDAVNTCFYTILNGVIDNYPTNISGSELGEVTQAKWISINELSNYDFSGKQAEHALSIFKEYCENNNTHNNAMLLKILNNMINNNEIDNNQYNSIINILNYGKKNN